MLSFPRPDDMSGAVVRKGIRAMMPKRFGSGEFGPMQEVVAEYELMEASTGPMPSKPAGPVTGAES